LEITNLTHRNLVDLGAWGPIINLLNIPDPNEKRNVKNKGNNFKNTLRLLLWPRRRNK
jgi:hypothetical protein